MEKYPEPALGAAPQPFDPADLPAALRGSRLNLAGSQDDSRRSFSDIMNCQSQNFLKNLHRNSGHWLRYSIDMDLDLMIWIRL